MMRASLISKTHLALAAAALLLAPLTSRADFIAESTFDTNLDGWTSNNPAQISWMSSGGNPGGFIFFNDLGGGGTAVFAPAKFLGSYAALNGAGTISFDHKIILERNVVSISPYEIFLSGPGGPPPGRGRRRRASAVG